MVPGNHDIPYYDLWRRVLAPLERFHRYISSVSSDVYIDDEIAVVGMNTVQRLAFTRGRITNAELTRVEKIFADIPTHVLRVVFAHHPIALPAPSLAHHRHMHQVVHGREKAITRLSNAKVDVFLSGHLHVFNVADTSVGNKIAGYGGVIISAGTALSTRLRGEDSSFNVVKLEGGHITVDHYRFDDDVREFNLRTTAQFAETPSGWKKI